MLESCSRDPIMSMMSSGLPWQVGKLFSGLKKMEMNGPKYTGNNFPVFSKDADQIGPNARTSNQEI